jgi:hypothetical protein
LAAWRIVFYHRSWNMEYGIMETLDRIGIKLFVLAALEEQ